jgi:hypothetical protein
MTKVDVVNAVTTIPGLPGSPFGQTGSPQIAVPAGHPRATLVLHNSEFLERGDRAAPVF